MKKYFLLIFTLLSLFGCSTTTNSAIEDDEDVTIGESSSSKNIKSSSSEKFSSSSNEKSSSSTNIPSLNEIYQNIEESATCTIRDSVAAYLCKFDHLPSNYVTKDKGKALYEEQGNTFSKWNFNPWTTIGVMIGGDSFDNYSTGKPEYYHPSIPEGAYHEADLQYNASNRGTKRLVYQGNCVIYYTADHYETFTQLFPKE